jgi:hypothetical protein
LADQFSTSAFILTPAFIVERISAVVQTGVELTARRTQAAYDFWAIAPSLREPKEVLALQAAYWRRALEDYTAVMSEAVSPTSPAQSAPMADAHRETPRAA